VADYLPLLRELTALDPPVFVFGSVAEAVLLDGKLNRSHGDVDLLVPRDELERKQRQLHELGFERFDVYYEPRPGRPLVLGSSRGELSLELNAVDYDEAGSPYFAVDAGSGPVGIFVPPDMFDWPPTPVSGVQVRTVSPLALIQIRAGLEATAVFGPSRPQKDRPRQRRLLEKYFPGRDPDSLRPDIVRLAERPS